MVYCTLSNNRPYHAYSSVKNAIWTPVQEKMAVILLTARKKNFNNSFFLFIVNNEGKLSFEEKGMCVVKLLSNSPDISPSIHPTCQVKCCEHLPRPSDNLGCCVVVVVLGQCRVKFDSKQTVSRHQPSISTESILNAFGVYIWNERRENNF